MKRDLLFEAFYDVAPEEVWLSLTDSTALAQWLMPNDFAPLLGRKFQFRDTPRGDWDGIVHCKVIELVPGKRLAYTWKSDTLDTVVKWSVERQGKGTKLILEHTGFRGFKAVLVSFMLGRGWKGTLLMKKLSAYLGARDVRVK